MTSTGIEACGRFAVGLKILRIDHFQLAMPPAGEEAARAFWVGLLGLGEVAKPPVLAARGGCWFVGGAEVHYGVKAPFTPAKKAHPEFVVDVIDSAAGALE